MEDTLVNRVANSGLITINLENFYPAQEMVDFDMKKYLFHELILKEKDFRTEMKELDWAMYGGKIVNVYCSTDAIIPVWAYMLVSSYLKDIASEIHIGDKSSYLNFYYKNLIDNINVTEYLDQRIVIKGCSNKPVPAAAYGYITFKLKDIAQSIMYGEPCSTVPITKRPRKLDK
jgi:hypothetical protein